MIADSTVIICLGKLNRLDLLRKLFGIIAIPNTVKEEVLVEGKEGYLIIGRAIKDGWIKVREPKTKLSLGLGSGESSAINLAVEARDKLIIDDAFAIKVAMAFNLQTIRTATVIFMAIGKGIISKEEAIILLNNLIEIGYYISPKVYAVLLTRLKQ